MFSPPQPPRSPASKGPSFVRIFAAPEAEQRTDCSHKVFFEAGLFYRFDGAPEEARCVRAPGPAESAGRWALRCSPLTQIFLNFFALSIKKNRGGPASSVCLGCLPK